MARRYSEQTIARRKAEFLRTFRGWPAYQLARALNYLTPGVSWTGCSKAFMSDEWASSANIIYRDIPLKAILSALQEVSGAQHPKAPSGTSKARARSCPCTQCRSDLLAAARHLLAILQHPRKSVTVLDAERLEAAIAQAEGAPPAGRAGKNKQGCAPRSRELGDSVHG